MAVIRASLAPTLLVALVLAGCKSGSDTAAGDAGTPPPAKAAAVNGSAPAPTAAPSAGPAADADKDAAAPNGMPGGGPTKK